MKKWNTTFGRKIILGFFYKNPLVSNGLYQCLFDVILSDIDKSKQSNLLLEQTESSFFLLKLFWLPLILFACLIWINYQQLKYV